MRDKMKNEKYMLLKHIVEQNFNGIYILYNAVF